MSVRIKEYYGNTGNNMFQYFTAFLFSHLNDLYFDTVMTEKMQRFISIKQNINGEKGKPINKFPEK